MISIDTLLSIKNENALEVAKSINAEDLPQLTQLLSEKDDKIRYAVLLLLQARSSYSDDVYPYLELFRDKLKSSNSYQRSIGMMLIAGNAKWDNQNRLDSMMGEYFALFHDEKPITIRQSIQALREIVPYKDRIIHKIAAELMSISITELRQTMQKSILLDIVDILLLIRKQQPTDEVESYLFSILTGGVLDAKEKKRIQTLM